MDKLQQIKIAMVDDHVLLRNALGTLINSFDDCKVISQCSNGLEFVQSLHDDWLPDVVLLDLSMPVMDGYETAVWLRDHHPSIHVLMLTMYDSELTLIRLLKAGVKGFIKKDAEPAELKLAIHSVVQSGYYYSTRTAGQLANLFRNNKGHASLQNSQLSDEEIAFLKLACTDMTYKEVAHHLHLTPRTIEALREQLFLKLDVKSRVGLAMVAIKNGVVTH